jgi:hypothetical protein
MLVRRLEKAVVVGKKLSFCPGRGRSGCCYVLYLKCQLKCTLHYVRCLLDAMNCEKACRTLDDIGSLGTYCAYLYLSDIVSESHNQ